jgi:hypothetical protein
LAIPQCHVYFFSIADNVIVGEHEALRVYYGSGTHSFDWNGLIEHVMDDLDCAYVDYAFAHFRKDVQNGFLIERRQATTLQTHESLVRQKSHSLALIAGSVFWQNEHIRFVLRMAMHVWQKINRKLFLLCVSFTSKAIILSIRGWISSMSSIFMT